MNMSSPVLITLCAIAFTPILARDALAADDVRESLSLNPASAPILRRDAGSLDRNRGSLSGDTSLPISGDAAAADRMRDTLLIGSRKAPYYSNRRLTLKNPDVTRAIIVIHGGGRNATDYFDAIMNSMPTSTDAARDWRRKTIVLAPHFQEKSEARKDELYWEGDWNRGG